VDTIILIFASIFLAALTTIVIVLILIQNHRKKNIKKNLEKLEVEKNLIDGIPILSELDKIETFLNNEKLEAMFKDWKERLEQIKLVQIPKLTDMIIDADYSLNQLNNKNTLYKIARLEMEVYKVRANANMLLDEIKGITSSEEKNRSIVTTLKAKYRDLYKKFGETKKEYLTTEKSVSLQFENIAYRFDDFEKSMEQNEYTEVTQIIKALDEMLKHMEVVTDELPSIELIANTLLPNKIEEVKKAHDAMIKEGYPLDYLNIEYNIEEANKKMSDILDRAKVLNLEDSLFELKVLLEYFDGIFNDFEKEKINRKVYDEANESFKIRLDSMNSLIRDIYAQIDDIRNVYNLSQSDMLLLKEVHQEIVSLNTDYKILLDHTGNNTFAYSKLTKEVEALMLRLANVEDRLDNSLDAIGSMKEDESRARQQLEEVKQIFKDSKTEIREHNLPVIPKQYFVELNEAQDAIKEIIRELDKKPITISILNTRVDTARDLVLKLYTTTKDMMKTAMFAEMAIVYGNRFRTSVEDLDKNLSYSESLFYKGDYQKSLELTINALNRIEPGIYDKLLSVYAEEK
jgi:septation ring formation regulator